jgi:hypothetical protein
MTLSVEKTLPKSIKDSRQSSVKLGDLSPVFAVAKTLPKSLKDSRHTSVKLGDLSPVFGARRI